MDFYMKISGFFILFYWIIWLRILITNWVNQGFLENWFYKLELFARKYFKLIYDFILGVYNVQNKRITLNKNIVNLSFKLKI